MSDPYVQRDLLRRLEQTEVKEVPGGISGFTTFYASGTWVPTYSGAGTTGVTTYTAQVGSYVRIGAVVAYTLYVGWSAATGTGQAVIGLPLNVVNVANQFSSASIWYQAVTYTGTGVIVLIRPNTARAELWTPTSNAASAAVNVEAAGELSMTGLYFVA